MDEARVGADELGEMGQEGDDVVLGHLLDLVDARDVERDVARLLPDRLRRFLGDDADLGQRVAGVRLDLEPDPEARLGRPDRDHLGAGIAGDHRALSLDRGRERSIGTRRKFRARSRRTPLQGSQLAGAHPGDPPRGFAANRRRRAGRRDRRRLGGAAFAGQGPRGDAGRPRRRGGDRDQLRQHRHRPERGGLPLHVSARAARESPRRRSTSIRACASATRRCRRSRRGCGAISSPPRPAGVWRRRWRCAGWSGAASPSIARSPSRPAPGRCCAKAAGSRPGARRAAKTIAMQDVEEEKPFGLPTVKLSREQTAGARTASRRDRPRRRPLSRAADDARPAGADADLRRAVRRARRRASSPATR